MVSNEILPKFCSEFMCPNCSKNIRIIPAYGDIKRNVLKKKKNPMKHTNKILLIFNILLKFNIQNTEHYLILVLLNNYIDYLSCTRIHCYLSRYSGSIRV